MSNGGTSVMAVNVRGSMLTCKHVVPVMVEQGGVRSGFAFDCRVPR